MTNQENILDAENVAAGINQGQDWVLIDVRTGIEFRAAHIAGARHIALNRLSPRNLRQLLPSRGRIIFTCEKGARAHTAWTRARDAGFHEVYELREGLAGWRNAGLPVVEGKSGVSLERQVRVAAGALVMLGIALGTWVHPGWYGLAGFVGAGLLFAGITNYCGMALLLARMPWNR